MQYAALIILGYFSGSIPFGKLIAWRQKVDIQRRGSGNIGFANVQRVLGWRASVPTLLGDVTKGLLPTIAAQQVTNSTFAYLVGVAAIIGHVFPVWLNGHGGKGIATGLGVVIALAPLAAAMGMLVYTIGRLTHKRSSWSSLAGVLTVVVAACILHPSDWWQYAVLLGIACWTLRKNITGKVPSYDF